LRPEKLLKRLKADVRDGRRDARPYVFEEKPLKRLKADVRPPHRAEAAVLMRELDDLNALALVSKAGVFSVFARKIFSCLPPSLAVISPRHEHS
jgi:hypothetical protein